MNRTLVVVILDESGSMENKKNDIISGFNNFLNEQQKIKEDIADLYLIKFNNSLKICHEGSINSMPNLTLNDYRPMGMTALYDAIFKGIQLADKMKKDGRVIFVIMTDGEENASKNIEKKEILELISNYNAKEDWTFLYIGESPDKWVSETGLSATNSAHWEHDGPQLSLSLASQGVSKFRKQNNKKVENLLE